MPSMDLFNFKDSTNIGSFPKFIQYGGERILVRDQDMMDRYIKPNNPTINIPKLKNLLVKNNIFVMYTYAAICEDTLASIHNSIDICFTFFLTQDSENPLDFYELEEQIDREFNLCGQVIICVASDLTINSPNINKIEVKI